MTNGEDEKPPKLELYFRSGSNIGFPFFSSKSRSYVLADIVDRRDGKPNWVHKTSIDEKGGEDPIWDFVIQFLLDQEMLNKATNFHLICKIMHSGTSLLGDRKISYVTVPLPDLLAGSAAGKYITETYPVEGSGTIDISRKLVMDGDIPAPPIEFLNTTYAPYSRDDHKNPILELLFHNGTDLPPPPLSDIKGMRPYIMAAIDHPNYTEPNWVKTVTDKNGRQNPKWNYMIHFLLNQEMVSMPMNFYLVCKIMHYGKKLGDRKIGMVKVRLQDFFAQDASGKNKTYKVEGEKGEIVISHRLLTNISGVSAPTPVGSQDRNHRAGRNVVNGARILAAAFTIGAAISDVVG